MSRNPTQFKRVRGGLVGRAAGIRKNGLEFILFCPDDETLQHVWNQIAIIEMSPKRVYDAMITKPYEDD
jgi:hypothetical protein